MSKTYVDVSEVFDRIRTPMRAAVVVTISHFDCGDYTERLLKIDFSEALHKDNQSSCEIFWETLRSAS